MSPLYGRFVEGDMCLDFDDGWTHVIAWDKHSAYKNGIRKVDGAKAVDFIGIRRNEALYFIEMKDYRFHRSPDGRKKHLNPWVELELKVRHSVAGLVGAHRRGCDDGACGPIIAALVERRMKLKLVYWLDEPPTRGSWRRPQKCGAKHARTPIGTRSSHF